MIEWIADKLGYYKQHIDPQLVYKQGSEVASLRMAYEDLDKVVVLFEAENERLRADLINHVEVIAAYEEEREQLRAAYSDRIQEGMELARELAKYKS
jgi:hypothetical protein